MWCICGLVADVWYEKWACYVVGHVGIYNVVDLVCGAHCREMAISVVRAWHHWLGSWRAEVM